MAKPHSDLDDVATDDRSSLSPVPYESDFDFDQYIPFRLVRTQLWMHRMHPPESTPRVKRIANISKVESRVILVVALNCAITPSQTADKLGFDPAIVARTISTLVSKELVVTQAHKTDQRSKSLHLTSRGKRLCDELIAVLRHFDEYLKTVIDESEAEQLSLILDKLLIGSREYSR